MLKVRTVVGSTREGAALFVALFEEAPQQGMSVSSLASMAEQIGTESESDKRYRGITTEVRLPTDVLHLRPAFWMRFHIFRPLTEAEREIFNSAFKRGVERVQAVNTGEAK